MRALVFLLLSGCAGPTYERVVDPGFVERNPCLQQCIVESQYSDTVALDLGHRQCRCQAISDKPYAVLKIVSWDTQY